MVFTVYVKSVEIRRIKIRKDDINWLLKEHVLSVEEQKMKIQGSTLIKMDKRLSYVNSVC